MGLTFEWHVGDGRGGIAVEAEAVEVDSHPFPQWEIERWIDSTPDCSEQPRNIKLDYTGSPDDVDRWIVTLEAVTTGGPDGAMWTTLTWQFYGATPTAAMVEAALWCREQPAPDDDR